MSLDKHNLTMAKATGLIHLLFDITSAQKVPFAIPLYIKYILHGLTNALIQFFSPQKVSILW